MQTNKEAMLSLYRGERADFIPNPYGVIKEVVFPGERYFDMKNKDPYATGYDDWGVKWSNRGPNPIIDGQTVAKDFRLFEDMSEWKKHVKFPKLNPLKIKMILNGMMKGMQINRKTDVVTCLMLSGQFERMNEMIGFENALCAFYDYPDEVHEFMDAMCEYKLKCIDIAYKAIKPDVIHMHDDWGTDDNMFFSPEIWREFIKPNIKRYVERIHSYGMLYQAHSCGYIKQIIPDLVELGVDAIDPMMVKNDVGECLEKYGTQMTFFGGIDNLGIDGPNFTEERLRKETRDAMDKYANKGRYVPYYAPATVESWGIFQDEVEKYGKKIFVK